MNKQNSIGLITVGEFDGIDTFRNRYTQFNLDLNYFLAQNARLLVLPVYFGYDWGVIEPVINDSKINHVPITMCGLSNCGSTVSYFEYFKEQRKNYEDQFTYVFENCSCILLFLAPNWWDNIHAYEWLRMLERYNSNSEKKVKCAVILLDPGKELIIKDELNEKDEDKPRYNLNFIRYFVVGPLVRNDEIFQFISEEPIN